MPGPIRKSGVRMDFISVLMFVMRASVGSLLLCLPLILSQLVMNPSAEFTPAVAVIQFVWAAAVLVYNDREDLK